MLKLVGRNFRDFLNGLDNIHEYLKFTYPKLKPPSFYCDEESSSGLVLHYRSKRSYNGFMYYVIGQLKAIGKTVYKQEVHVNVLNHEGSGNMFNVKFQVVFNNAGKSV